MLVEQLPISTLSPYSDNPRQHSPEQVRQIAASIKEFGWTVPILVDASGVVIAGHGRLLAAEQIGLSEVPAIRIEHLTENQIRAYRIADNRLTELGEWHLESLSDEIEALSLADFDVTLTGFTGEALEALLIPDDLELDLEEQPHLDEKKPTVCPSCGHEFTA